MQNSKLYAMDLEKKEKNSSFYRVVWPPNPQSLNGEQYCFLFIFIFVLSVCIRIQLMDELLLEHIQCVAVGWTRVLLAHNPFQTQLMCYLLKSTFTKRCSGVFSCRKTNSLINIPKRVGKFRVSIRWCGWWLHMRETWECVNQCDKHPRNVICVLNFLRRENCENVRTI